MGELVAAAFRAVGSLFIRGMFGVFVKSVLLTCAVLGILAVAVFKLSFVLKDHLEQHYLWAEWLPFMGTMGAILSVWVLFPGIMPVIVSFFDMRITRAIEEHDYPASAQPLTLPFWPEFWHDVRFSLKAVVLNVVVLPLYLVPGLNLILFYWLNGYLLGREYFVMAARRHMPAAQAEELRRQHGGKVLGGGVLLTLVATIPIVNLFAPFWGVAMMVHLYHLVGQTRPSQILPPQLH